MGAALLRVLGLLGAIWLPLEGNTRFGGKAGVQTALLKGCSITCRLDMDESSSAPPPLDDEDEDGVVEEAGVTPDAWRVQEGTEMLWLWLWLGQDEMLLALLMQELELCLRSCWWWGEWWQWQCCDWLPACCMLHGCLTAYMLAVLLE